MNYWSFFVFVPEPLRVLCVNVLLKHVEKTITDDVFEDPDFFQVGNNLNNHLVLRGTLLLSPASWSVRLF